MDLQARLQQLMDDCQAWPAHTTNFIASCVSELGVPGGKTAREIYFEQQLAEVTEDAGSLQSPIASWPYDHRCLPPRGMEDKLSMRNQCVDFMVPSRRGERHPCRICGSSVPDDYRGALAGRSFCRCGTIPSLACAPLAHVDFGVCRWRTFSVRVDHHM